MKQFDFGENWKNFSKKAMSEKNKEQARIDFSELTEKINLTDKTFLDIGFGQGLSLLIATENLVIPVGCDINPKCSSVLNYNRNFFKNIENVNIPIITGSILEDETIKEIKNNSNKFDVVHSWGVLHHTGKMWKTVKIASSLVDKEGYLIIAIYNKHWTSKIWRTVKKIYNFVPKFFKKIMLFTYIPLLFIRTIISGIKNFRQIRGMDFYYDAIDWLGGYPYEYASKQEIIDFLKNDFELIKYIPTWGFSGCNQFVFKRKNSR